jgi:hypothetical protein
MQRLILTVIAVVIVMLRTHGGEPISATMVPVAVYSPKSERDGSRVYAILKEQGIQAVGTESASVCISVPSTDAARARALLSEALPREHLRITILPEDKPK